MPGNHRTARNAVVDEHTGAGGLPTQHGLLSWVDQRQVPAARCSRGCMEIDIVQHRVGVGIDERYLDIVSLVHDHERRRDRPVEAHRPKFRAPVVDYNLLLLDDEPKFHDLGALLGRLLVGMHVRRCDEIDLLSWQLQILGHHRCSENNGCQWGARYCGSSGDHYHSPGRYGTANEPPSAALKSRVEQLDYA